MSGEGSIMTEGMGGDRASLSLRESDERLIAAAAAANPRTVVVLVGAGTIMMEAWRGTVPAILLMWYAGMEGGHALGRVLAGDVDPSGRLPFAIPADPDALPSMNGTVQVTFQSPLVSGKSSFATAARSRSAPMMAFE